MSERPLDLLPELILLGGALSGLITGLFLPRRRQGVVAGVAGIAALAAMAAAGWQWTGPTRYAFADSYRVDTLTDAVRVTVCGALLLLLPLARGRYRDHPRETEVYVLMLLASLGAVTLAGANDLLLLMGAYMLASVPLYALTGFAKDAPGTEAAMKYYLMGALLGITMLAGITVLYGLAGQTAYPALPSGLVEAPAGPLAFAVVAVLAGLAFKSGAVPAHFWIPDVADGTPAAVAAFVTTIPKLGGLAALFRLFDGPLQHIDLQWRLLLAVLATASMTLGNLAAFFQTSPRRLLGYSTISQVGYLLLPIVVAGRADSARDALLFYLAGYAVTNVGAFAVAAALPRRNTLEDYRGLIGSHPGLSLALILSLLGLIGTPPLAVFIGKLGAFSVAIDGGYTWLAAVAAINTVASVFYYLRWISPVVRSSTSRSSAGDAIPGGESAANHAIAGQVSALVAYAAAGGGLLLGLLAGLLLGNASGAGL